MAAFSITFSSLIISFFLVSPLTLHSAHEPPRQRPGCPPLSFCGIHDIKFPFSSASNPECGLQTIECKDGVATIKFDGPKGPYIVSYIDYSKNILGIVDDRGGCGQQKSDICDCLHNFTTPISYLLPFELLTPQYTFLKCSHSKHQMLFTDPIQGLFNYSGCHDYKLYYYWDNPPYVGHNRHNCSVIHLPVLNWTYLGIPGNFTLPELLAQSVYLRWNLTPECVDCDSNKGGSCGRNRSSGKFTCLEPIKKKGDKGQQIKIGSIEAHNGPNYFGSSSPTYVTNRISAGLGGILLACVVFFIFRQCRNRRLHPASSILLPRAFSSFPYSKPELGKGSTLFHTQIFTYKELEEATDNFNPLRKLGGGGFGTVYYGKLRDGRFVAVKRLYENSYKQTEHFRNEIGILSRLRHQNLVTLYGCGSRHSHELLLVYEFIPNGTVADHLHCNRAKPGVLTWPIRLSIAIETADALAYLHNVEIIHRDVKTNNILLDDDFHVKVADFGLSRLFSFEASHVSTAPQGTPGYVDPNYHRYYQLTDKSDVYSFGVVLIELISSMPAVDVTRHQHEINLANMAINKIQNDALPELVDPALGFDSNFAVRRMITLVAELAFRCLQDQREVRPSMEEVSQVLRGIGNEIEKVEKTEEVSTMADHTTLLKQAPAMSPDTVTDAWVSRTGTPDINALYIHSLD